MKNMENHTFHMKNTETFMEIFKFFLIHQFIYHNTYWMPYILEKEMTTHSSINAWEIPQQSLAAVVHGVEKESDMTERLNDNLLRI